MALNLALKISKSAFAHERNGKRGDETQKREVENIKDYYADCVSTVFENPNMIHQRHVSSHIRQSNEQNRSIEIPANVCDVHEMRENK